MSKKGAKSFFMLGLAMLNSVKKQLLVFSLPLILSAMATAEDFNKDCESEYGKSVPTERHGAVRYSSKKNKDEKECAGQVGSTFCLDNKVTTYMKECVAQKKKEKKEKFNEFRKTIKKADQLEEQEKLDVQEKRKETGDIFYSPE